MRVIFLMVTFLLLNVGIFGSGLTYLIADGSLGTGDIYIKGLKGNGDILEEGEVIIERVKIYNYSDDIEVGLFKISIDDGGSGSKIVVGYEQGGRYILLSTREARGEENISNNYDAATGAEDYLGLIDPQDYIDEKIFYTKSPYERFPGYEVDEGRIIMGVRIGEKEIEDEERTDPSNIVEKFSSPGSGDEIVTDEEEGVGINPNASDLNHRLKIIDVDGTTYIMKKDEKKNKNDEEYDPEEWEDIEDYYDSGEKIKERAVTYLRFRLKGGDEKLRINGVSVSLGKQDKLYEVETETSFNVTVKKGNGNGHWTLEINGQGVTITPRPEGVPEAAEDVVYVIEGVGTKYEGSVQMSSESEGSGRQRVSDINIEILVNDSSGLEIESISE